MAGRRRALIVATLTYQDAGLTRLQAPDADAEALAGVLADPAIGDFEVTTVVDARAHEVSRAVAAFFHEGHADDLLLLHFSCHGLKDDSGELYFAATDTDLDLLDATAVPSGFVNRAMDRSRAGRVLLLLDCCYAGAFARGMTARAAGTVDVNERLGGRGRAVITASSALQFAFEGQAPADVASAAPSVFTSALVRGLATGEADRNQDGWVSLDELYAYVHDEVTRDNPDQTPKKWTFDIEGDLYVARRGRPVSSPSRLPAEIRQTLDSLLTWERASAVEPLGELLTGDHPGLALAARRALERLAADDDSVRVRTAAQQALEAAAPQSSAQSSAQSSVPSSAQSSGESSVGSGPSPATRALPVVPSAAGAAPVAAAPAGRRTRRRVLVGAAAAVVLAGVTTWLVLPHDGGGGSGDRLPGTLSDSTILLAQAHDGPSELVSFSVTSPSGDTTPVLDSDRAALPTISPDRTEMVYLYGVASRSRSARIAGVDGSGDRPLLTGAAASTCPTSGRPAWSPTGRLLALVCADGRLYTVRPDGTRLTAVSGAVRPVGAPTWADATDVVYESAGPAATDAHTLRTVSTDGSSPARQLTDGTRGSDTQPDAFDGVGGGGVVFLRTRVPAKDAPGDIWIWRPDGETRRTRDGLAGWPAVSPDGGSLVWLQHASPTGVTTSLWLGSMDGGGARLPVSGDLRPPAWGSR